MIISRIHPGQGFGNQLWCLTTAYALSLKKKFDFIKVHILGVSVHIPTVWLEIKFFRFYFFFSLGMLLLEGNVSGMQNTQCNSDPPTSGGLSVVKEKKKTKIAGQKVHILKIPLPEQLRRQRSSINCGPKLGSIGHGYRAKLSTGLDELSA